VPLSANLVIVTVFGPAQLERLARFLANVVEAWDSASQEQRNKLARCLFDEIWMRYG
jgi:hypothetical protein